jgi:hypothetical protein
MNHSIKKVLFVLLMSAFSTIQVKASTADKSLQGTTFASMQQLFQSVCSIGKSVSAFRQNQITLSRVFAVAGLAVAAYFIKNRLQRSKLIAHKAKQLEKQEEYGVDLPSSSLISSSGVISDQTSQEESELDLEGIIAPNAFTDMMKNWKKLNSK